MHPPDPHFDAEQDAELRAVEVPEGLQRRLRHMALAADEGLDAAVRAVPLPSGLIDRLRLGVLADDEGLDAVIRDVPVPVDLASELDRSPKARLRLARLTQWATAVSLVVAIGLSYIGAVVGLVALSYPTSDRSRPELDTFLESDWSDLADGGVWLAPVDRPLEPRRTIGVPVPEIAFEPLLTTGIEDPTDILNIRSLSDPLPHRRWDDAEGVLAEDPLEDVRRNELRLVPGLVPEGIRMPLAPGYPRDFFIKYGVLGLVPPAMHTELRSTVVPLDIDTASYELARRNLEEGRWPPAKLIRTEEFLAAMDYQFPRPKQRAVELHTAAGSSPFGYNYPISVQGTIRNVRPQMLQIGVRARDLDRRQHAPVHLVLLVDVSASMCWGGRLEMTRDALKQLAEYLGPDDRVSLVAFSENAELVIEGAGREHADQLYAAAELLAPQASTHLAEGLRKAYSVTLIDVEPDQLETRVVLLTDGRAEVAAGTRSVIESRLAEAAAHGVTLDVIDLRQDDKEPHTQMARFARAGGGAIRRAVGTDQIGWALKESLTGQSQLVAEEVKLKVDFNPGTVLAYRLIGHEPKLGGVLPADPQADFHAGRSATALYEIWLRPTDTENGSDEVATAELTFREPGSETIQTVGREVRRRHFASKFIEAPLSLQEAIIVAQAAEVLRGSPFARVRPDDPRSMAGVLAQAKHVNTELYLRPSFARFISILERAEGVK